MSHRVQSEMRWSVLASKRAQGRRRGRMVGTSPEASSGAAFWSADAVGFSRSCSSSARSRSVCVPGCGCGSSFAWVSMQGWLTVPNSSASPVRGSSGSIGRYLERFANTPCYGDFETMLSCSPPPHHFARNFIRLCRSAGGDSRHSIGALSLASWPERSPHVGSFYH